MSETVAKFGGTSMARPEEVASVLDNHTDAGIIVVSAPGINKNAGVDVKMTDQLYEYADLLGINPDASHKKDLKTAGELRDEMIARFDALYSSLGSADRRQLRDISSDILQGAVERDSPDTISAIGEEISAHYFARLLGATLLMPHWIRMTGKGKVDRQATTELFANEFTRISGKGRVVIPGYYGYTTDGHVEVLDRGGSDRTGALAAVGLRRLTDRVIYENWTDKDGIFSTNPDKIREAILNPILTRDEVREGAHGGSGILQGDTIIDLNGSDIPVHVRNTLNPDAPGTMVVQERDVDPNRPVVSVTGKELGVITVQDMGMADDIGYIEAITSLVKDSGLPLEHMPTAQDALSMTFHGDVTDEQLEKIAEGIRSATRSETASVFSHRSGVIYMVGEALRSSVELTQVTAKAAEILLQDGGKGFQTSVSHPHSPSLALLVDQADLESGQRKLHKAFIG